MEYYLEDVENPSGGMGTSVLSQGESNLRALDMIAQGVKLE